MSAALAGSEKADAEAATRPAAAMALKKFMCGLPRIERSANALMASV
jgi:hypothetical protein